MNLPPDIQERVAEALAALHSHPERALLPWYRYAIYSAMGETDPLYGLAARARLDIAVARRALFCWPAYERAVWPRGWAQPADLLDLAGRLLGGAIAPADAARQIDRAHALADVAGEPETSPHYCAWCVFEAARRAAEGALGYARASATGAGALFSQRSTDDASGYAAIAIGGGEWASVNDTAGRWNWQTEEVRLRRAVFWEWWLREAIPGAWRLASQSYTTEID